MPLTTTFATLSARGFGLFGRQKVLTTVTFPGGTTTWTAPFGVTSLVSLVGKGQDGAGGYYYNTEFANQTYNLIKIGGTSLTNPPPPPTIADSCVDEIVAFINSYSGLQYIGGETFSPTMSVYQSIFDSTWFYQSYGSTSPSSGWNGGGWVVGGTGSYSNTATSPNISIQINYQTYSFPYTGANTTAFGYTFPGGVEAPASTFTYNNVPVTPGSTYTIVNNGSVTITYYV